MVGVSRVQGGGGCQNILMHEGWVGGWLGGGVVEVGGEVWEGGVKIDVFHKKDGKMHRNRHSKCQIGAVFKKKFSF